MSSEMIERVAKAIDDFSIYCIWEHEDHSFDSSQSDYEVRGPNGLVVKVMGEIAAVQECARLRARAAIEAMREPTEPMLEASDIFITDNAIGEWQAMIDAALT